jgi:hypothetical protein
MLARERPPSDKLTVEVGLVEASSKNLITESVASLTTPAYLRDFVLSERVQKVGQDNFLEHKWVLNYIIK